MLETSGLRDAMYAAFEMGRGMADGIGMFGYGVAHLLDGDNKTKLIVPFGNLITNKGDQHYACKGSPSTPAGSLTITGMKLGTGTNAANHKSNQYYASLQTAASGSNVFKALTTSAVNAVGTNTGYTIDYVCSWAAGDATNTSPPLAEVVLTDGTGTQADLVANVISRALFSSTISKAADDTLTVTWKHKFLGA